MNNTRNLGIMLIAIGIIMMMYTGFNYITTKNIVNLGPVQINKEENHPVQWSPVIGAALLIGGIAIIAVTRKKKLNV